MEPEQDCLAIEIPATMMDERALANLDRIIEAKGNLLRKALATDSLVYEVGEKRILFPWFTLTGDEDEAEAYMQLISALADMARNSKGEGSRKREVLIPMLPVEAWIHRAGVQEQQKDFDEEFGR